MQIFSQNGKFLCIQGKHRILILNSKFSNWRRHCYFGYKCKIRKVQSYIWKVWYLFSINHSKAKKRYKYIIKKLWFFYMSGALGQFQFIQITCQECNGKYSNLTHIHETNNSRKRSKQYHFYANVLQFYITSTHNKFSLIRF